MSGKFVQASPPSAEHPPDHNRHVESFLPSSVEVPWIRLAVGLVFLFLIADLVMDIVNEGASARLAIDGVLSISSITLFALLFHKMRATRLRVARLESGLLAIQEEKRALLRGLSDTIEMQLDRWKLSRAEKEIAYLLLKGLSHREIAGIRKTSERTARQQSLNIYSKAGLNGRTDLAAFFLEDMLAPVNPVFSEPVQPEDPRQSSPDRPPAEVHRTLLGPG